MTDPYKVLQVSPDASDAEVKKAYRELARKYHPDHYHGTDMEHMAEEKMKEINEAYATIESWRKNGNSQQQSYGGYGSYGNTYQQSSSSTNPLFQRVRMAINRGEIAAAEEMLRQTDLRTAEWHFLMGAIRYRQGWLDEAAQEFEMACGMDPDNMEYRQAYQHMRGGGTSYRPSEYGNGGMMGCDCGSLLCNAMLCNMCCTPCVPCC